MSKIGFNIYSLTTHPMPYVHNEASRWWLPDLQEFNPLVLGPVAKVSPPMIRYGSGNGNRTMSYAETMVNGFTIMHFIRLCKLLRSTPIINPTVFRPIEDAVNIIRQVRTVYDGDICLMVGNESFLGSWVIDGEYPKDCTPQQYIDFYLGLHEALGTDTHIKFGPTLVDIELHGYEDWSPLVMAGVGDKADWVSFHCYQSNVDDANALLGRTQQFGKPVIVTEWNHPQHAALVNDPVIYDWTMDMLRLFDSLPYVTAHCIWDSGAGSPWKLFEKDGSPTTQWQAIEAYTRED